MNDTPERVWRVRKNHTWIDAQVRECAEAPGVEMRFYYDGSLVFSRQWATRDEALTCAAVHLRELQRAGWITHW